jgi:lipoprotein-anchoring transpeptidase ErfK/SrfK
MRTSVLALLAAFAVTPAGAQSLSGDGPGASQRTAPRAKAKAAPKAKARTSVDARRQATAPRRQAQQQFGFFSLFAADDDDDDDDRRRPRRAAQGPSGGLDRAAVPKGPPVLDGGGRPAISPAAPPVVAYTAGHAAGTVVIDAGARALYYVLPGNRAYRYSVAVGREGFGWTGTQTVSRIAAWPDWRPPAEMRERDPRLPELMTGGVRNPLGAKAIYLGSTLYRIHGTNDARSIGTASSSGCFRMTNSNVLHLAQLVRTGTRVHVVRSLPRNVAAPISRPPPRG